MTTRDHARNSRPSDARPHAQREEMLPTYAALIAGGRSPGVEWRDLEQHLADCQPCRDELRALTEAIEAVAAGRVAGAGCYPRPDLSFLSPAPDERAADGRAGLPALVRQVVIGLGEALRASLQAPELAGGFRSASPDGGPPESQPSTYRHPPAGAGLAVTVEVAVTDRAHQLCRVTVTVDDPRDPLPERESSVVVQYDLVSQTAMTDIGTVAFADVPLTALDHLRITVTKSDRAAPGG